MPIVVFQNNQFDTEHEATCAALFNRYGWRWEKPKHPVGGWVPDFLLKGDTLVYVECKGGLRWEDVPQWPDLVRYEDAVNGSSYEVLLIPETPKRMQNDRGYTKSALGFLYDGSLWSHAELGRWSNRVGFCHSANSWKDRISGEQVSGRSMGDGNRPDIDIDWRSAIQTVRGKRVSYFKGSVTDPIEEWEPRL